MANPVEVVCTKDSWTKVAAGVTSGQIKILDKAGILLEMHKITTDPAPTLRSDGALIQGIDIDLSASASTDFYIWSDSANSTVRVDL